MNTYIVKPVNCYELQITSTIFLPQITIPVESAIFFFSI